MAENNAELLAQLESIEIPKAMVTSAQLIALLKTHAKNPPTPPSPEEALQIQTQISAAHLGSHLEILANLGSIDRQLRQLGAAVKELRGE